MKKFGILVALFAAAVLACAALAGGLAVGQKAPDFRVESGEEKALDSAQLNGKVVTLFYEAKDETEKSRPLKNELKNFFAEQPAKIKNLVARVAVVDCSGASWLFKGMWQGGLKEASQKEGLTVYGDWDGRMRAAYGLPEDGTSFLVLGADGKVKYIAKDASRIKAGQFKQIQEVITQAVKQAEKP